MPQDTVPMRLHRNFLRVALVAMAAVWLTVGCAALDEMSGNSKPYKSGFYQDAGVWNPVGNDNVDSGEDRPDPDGKGHGQGGIRVAPGGQRVINIPGETYVETSPSDGPGGFYQDGVYYKKYHKYLAGEEYVPGNPSQRGGFWQNGKYYVRKSSGGGGGGGPVAGRHVINIPGQTYIESNPNQGKGGFYQDGKYYLPYHEYLAGEEYVPGNPNQKGGFWQNGKYYVRKSSGGGGGGAPSAGRHVINIPGQTYIESNPNQGKGGFWQNGKYYLPHHEHLAGDEYVPGNPNQRGGFWQNGKYYVKK